MSLYITHKWVTVRDRIHDPYLVTSLCFWDESISSVRCWTLFFSVIHYTSFYVVPSSSLPTLPSPHSEISPTCLLLDFFNSFLRHVRHLPRVKSSSELSTLLACLPRTTVQVPGRSFVRTDLILLPPLRILLQPLSSFVVTQYIPEHPIKFLKPKLRLTRLFTNLPKITFSLYATAQNYHSESDFPLFPSSSLVKTLWNPLFTPQNVISLSVLLTTLHRPKICVKFLCRLKQLPQLHPTSVFSLIRTPNSSVTFLTLDFKIIDSTPSDTLLVQTPLWVVQSKLVQFKLNKHTIGSISHPSTYILKRSQVFFLKPDFTCKTVWVTYLS